MFYRVAQYTGFTREFFAFKIFPCFTVHAFVLSPLHPEGKCVSRLPCSSYILCCCPSYPAHTARRKHIMTPRVMQFRCPLVMFLLSAARRSVLRQERNSSSAKQTVRTASHCVCPQPDQFTPHFSCNSELQINIAITSTPSSSRWFPSFRFSPQTLYICSLLPHSCYLLLPSDPRSLCSYIFTLLVLCSIMFHESLVYPCGVVLPIDVLIMSSRCSQYSH